MKGQVGKRWFRVFIHMENQIGKPIRRLLSLQIYLLFRDVPVYSELIN